MSIDSSNSEYERLPYFARSPFYHTTTRRLRYFALTSCGLEEVVTPLRSHQHAAPRPFEGLNLFEGDQRFIILLGSGVGLGRHPMSITEEDWAIVCDAWRIPRKLLKRSFVAHDYLEHCYEELPATADDSLLLTNGVRPVQKFLKFMLRIEKRGEGITCLLCCDLTTRAPTRCLITAERNVDAAELVSSIKDYASDVLSNPSVIISFILALLLMVQTRAILHHSETAHALEQRLGVVDTVTRDFFAMRGFIDEPDGDYKCIIVDLHSLRWRLNEVCHVHAQTLLLARALLHVLELHTDRVQSAGAFEAVDYAIRRHELGKAQLGFWLNTLQNQNMMLFNQINQRDSRLSYSVARSSGQIAAASRGDSSAMKTISILTLAFLPGTFVSSVFSTQIFDFLGPGDGYGRVGKAWWICMLCGLILTLLTVASWAGWMVWRMSKAAQDE